MRELAPALLRRFTRPHADHDAALIAIATEASQGICVAEARHALSDESPGAREFGLNVADRWHRAGRGSALLGGLIAMAE